jgi:hypothetical protein
MNFYEEWYVGQKPNLSIALKTAMLPKLTLVRAESPEQSKKGHNEAR